MHKAVAFLCLLLPFLAAATESISCPQQLRTYHTYDRSGQALSCIDKWQTDFFNELGCPIQFQNGNPLTTVREKMLRQQQVELLVGLSQSPQRPYQFSQPFGEHKYQFYRRSDDTRWQQITDWCDSTMRQANIIMPMQGYLGEAVEILRADKNCSKSLHPAPPGYALALEMLEKRRADLMLSSDIWLDRMPAEQAEKYQPLPFFSWQDQIRIAFADNVPASFIQQVNDLLQRRIAQGSQACGLDLPSTAPEVNAAKH